MHKPDFRLQRVELSAQQVFVLVRAASREHLVTAVLSMIWLLPYGVEQ